ncbi:IS4 family transposase [Phocaeicola sp. Sa1CVN1]|uniref:IS4 family transposase n=1 Tax=Phocaeicola intestinalis TaxID=2762212 RepID=A0ABR8YAH0_9BACT|nr:IS4 family transposase [Phocaeicola intestinalis]MBD8041049.1 IS4 family transposase [Phocaeicola intestinalis]
MNQGKFVFSQVVEYIPRYQFDKLVKQYKGDWHTKNLSSYNHLLHLLFGQLTGCDSLRDICLCLEAHNKTLYHLGFRKAVSHTSLSRANESRDYRIFEGLGLYLIATVRPMYSNIQLSQITIDNVIYALDSTTISTSIKLATWALGKYSKGAVKMHTLLDLRGGIPANIHITDGKWHDSNELDALTPEPYAFYVMDKAYVDFKALFRFHQAQAFWVSRPKENMKFETVEQMDISDVKSGVLEDSRIRVTGYNSSKLYPEDMRFVRVYDPDNDTIVDFISNNFEVSALEISNLYRHRWDIEVFFKWIKQNITVKTLWGYSENAVKIHLWAAIISYLTLARIKVACNSPYSITEVATLIRISALERTDLRSLITKLDSSIISNQNVKELSLFDDI